ncbi:tyrosine-type recombinase/integrase [Pontibacillus salipaludis]|uniref:Tyrosine recombinase XerC n=1 Tax=Pontibacillus salipaludis TaxID=1697394 RepID=A0ABQ1PKX8_9BACI|nr:tyrosine-type recombinase/integrase [Pontibacillus salipaludis]GGC98817.1 tyrosine recombinase XerC [Pontibacillus salipaludis]
MNNQTTIQTIHHITQQQIDWSSPDLYHKIMQVGFRDIPWGQVPDELLLYLFLHDDPTLGSRRKTSTLKEYFRDVRQFIEYIQTDGHTIQTIHHEDLGRYQLYLESCSYRPTTLRRKSTVVSQFLSYLHNRDIVNYDLTKSMKRISVKKEQLVNRDFYEEEVEELLKYFKEHDYYMYTMLYTLVSTGLRIQEFAEAKWSEVFYQPDVGLYFVSVIGKRSKLREVPLFEEVLEVISEFRMRRGFSGDLDGDETPLFPKPNGEHYNFKYLSNEFTKQIENLHTIFPFIQQRLDRQERYAKTSNPIKFKITPHTCRHYTASYYLSKGADLKAIQDLLDHESSSTTDNYLRRKRKFQDHAAVKIGGQFMK